MRVDSCPPLRFPQRRRRAVSASNRESRRLYFKRFAHRHLDRNDHPRQLPPLLIFAATSASLWHVVLTRGSGRGHHASAIFDAPVVQLHRRRVGFCIARLLRKHRSRFIIRRASTGSYGGYGRVRACRSAKLSWEAHTMVNRGREPAARTSVHHASAFVSSLEPFKGRDLRTSAISFSTKASQSN